MNKKRIIPLVALLLVSTTLALAGPIVVHEWMRVDSNFETPEEQEDIGVTGLGLFELTYEHDFPEPDSPVCIDYNTWYHIYLVIEAEGVEADWSLYFEVVIQTDDPDGMSDPSHTSRFQGAWKGSDSSRPGDYQAGGYTDMAEDEWTPFDGGMYLGNNGFVAEFGDGSIEMTDDEVHYVNFAFRLHDQAVGYGFLLRLSFRLWGDEVVP